MPGSVEDYVHRIGRTSRGEGATGHALTFFEYWRGAPLLAKELCALLAQAGQRVPRRDARGVTQTAVDPGQS